MGRKLIYNVKENKNEYMKKYFQENKEMTTCECGCTIDKYSMRRHLLSKKHIQVIEHLEINKYLEKIKELEDKLGISNEDN